MLSIQQRHVSITIEPIVDSSVVFVDVSSVGVLVLAIKSAPVTTNNASELQLYTLYREFKALP